MGHRSSLYYSLVRRVAALWAIEVVALWSLANILPGVSLNGWGAAVLAVALIALANAIIRPGLIYATLPFTILSFGLLSLLMNAVVLWLASLATPGFEIDSLTFGFLTALGLSLVNTLATSIFAFNEEDSVYRNVVRRLARRGRKFPDPPTPGLVFIEFDGLATETLKHAMEAGYLPTLSSWVEKGSHRIVGWNCGLPSQTSSVQAGLLLGNNFDIPGFRWYEKESGEMIVSNDPADALHIESRASRGTGLLRENGISICNMFTGDADTSVATVSRWSSPKRAATTGAYFVFFVSPYNFTRALVLMVREMAIEAWEAARQSVEGVTPRVSRRGFFSLFRATSGVFMRELGAYVMMSEMYSGVSIAYMTLVSYDVVAHHAGPERKDALRVLRDLDRRVAMLARAAADAPRPYRFVILSDHGQTPGIPFRHKHGKSLEDVVRELLNQKRSVRAARTRPEGRGHVNTLLSEAMRHPKLSGRAARVLLRRRTHDAPVELGSRKKPTRGDVMVCTSGNLGHIYFTQTPGRVTLEELATDLRELIEGLVAHEGIGFVMVRSSVHGPLVMGRGGLHYLNTGAVEGIDPLRGYGPRTAQHLLRLDGFPHCGDIVLNGRYHPREGVVETFEEMVGVHGGAGGAQTDPFIMAPAGWPLPASITNPEEMHQVFVRWRDALATGQEPGEHLDDGSRAGV